MTSALARRIGRIEVRTGLNRARSVRDLTDEELDEAILAGGECLAFTRSGALAHMSDEALNAMMARLMKANRDG